VGGSSGRPCPGHDLHAMDDHGEVLLAGAAGNLSLRLPLVYQGETVGELVLGPRPGEGAFAASDRRLLDDLARHLAGYEFVAHCDCEGGDMCAHAVALLLAAVSSVASAKTSPALRGLRIALRSGMRHIGGASSAYVVDMTTGQTLFGWDANVGRMPASVEKLYTTSTVLLKFGAATRLSTQVLASGQLHGSTFTGTLYLRGGGDPTYGSAGFIQTNYGSGASVQQLVSNLVRATGMQSFHGTVVADESMLDSLRGTPPYGYQPSIDVEGVLSALARREDSPSAQITGHALAFQVLSLELLLSREGTAYLV